MRADGFAKDPDIEVIATALHVPPLETIPGVILIAAAEGKRV